MTPILGGGRPIFDLMVQFFKNDSWNFQQIEGRPILTMGFKGDNGRWDCFAQAREEQKQFVFYSVLDARVPPEKRSAVAEFICRANYGLILGNFEMDFSDGEVRYKTSIDVKESEDKLTHGLLKRLVYVNVVMMDKYFPGLMGVIYAGQSPAEAMAKVES